MLITFAWAPVRRGEQTLRRIEGGSRRGRVRWLRAARAADGGGDFGGTETAIRLRARRSRVIREAQGSSASERMDSAARSALPSDASRTPSYGNESVCAV